MIRDFEDKDFKNHFIISKGPYKLYVTLLMHFCDPTYLDDILFSKISTTLLLLWALNCKKKGKESLFQSLILLWNFLAQKHYNQNLKSIKKFM